MKRVIFSYCLVCFCLLQTLAYGSNSVAKTGVVSLDRDSLNMSIFPNPVASELTVQFNQFFRGGELLITNVLGATVRTVTIAEQVKQQEIFIGDLESGVYFISLVSSGKTVLTKRFQVVKN